MGLRTVAKAERLNRIAALLFCARQGLTTAELARHFGVDQRTIERDLTDLDLGMGMPVVQEGHRYKLMDTYQLPKLQITLHEAAALFLAVRLYSQGCDERNPHAGSALSKLAVVLPEPMGRHVTLTAHHLAGKIENPRFVHVLETLVAGWAKRRKVKILYQSARSENVHEQVLWPYFLEAQGAGHATYVMGYAEWFQAIRTFKLERITRAELTNDEFIPPDNLDFAAKLESSWGVIWNDHGGEEVRLRFTPAVTRRVKETIWHSSQVIDDCEGGGCLLTVRVGSTLEMVPWIRGWGPEVEVVAPSGLREQIAEDMRRAAEVYVNGTAAQNY
ncbi:MAG: WYL domain-containing protein [Chloroflexota bacterium]|nr:MAG: WYL domain-containing protein [Chloroflexota bacterium]